MPTNVWPGGLDGDDTDVAAYGTPLLTPGNILFVSYARGSDSNDGLSSEGAKKTLAAAYSASSAGDIIALAADHAETITAAIVVTQHVMIVGLGNDANGKPTAQLTLNSGSAEMFDLRASGIQLRNIYFPTNAQANGAARIYIGDTSSVTGVQLVNCYFDCAGNDDNAAVIVSSSATPHVGITFDSCTWLSTATTFATRPSQAVAVYDTRDFVMRDCTFDGGAHGFKGDLIGEDGVAFAAYDLSSTCLRCWIHGAHFLRGADLYLKSSITGFITDVTTTGSSRIIW